MTSRGKGSKSKEARKDRARPASASNRKMSKPQQSGPLWRLLNSAYVALNASFPNLTNSCWLCYQASPPYYEASAVTSLSLSGTTQEGCRWQRQMESGTTLQVVRGRGTCISPTVSAGSMCNHTVLSNASLFYPAPGNTWWACNASGVTPCVSGTVLQSNKEWCLLVRLYPRIIYHPYKELLSSLRPTTSLSRERREVATAIITVAGLLGLAGTGLGATAVARQVNQYSALRMAIDEDLARIDRSIAGLTKSLRSLSEVVLQNRRGLDLLFLQQGGLCAALGEECCFYADHTGVVEDSMAKVREGLEKRKREREQQEGWFESWFNYSPWLTTLLSAITGPLLLLIIILTIGPCVINKLVTFVKDRINTVQLMVLRTQYQALDEQEL